MTKLQTDIHYTDWIQIFHMRPAFPIIFHFPSRRYRSSFHFHQPSRGECSHNQSQSYSDLFYRDVPGNWNKFFFENNPAVAKIRTADLQCRDIALQTTWPPRHPCEILLWYLGSTQIYFQCNVRSVDYGAKVKEQWQFKKVILSKTPKNGSFIIFKFAITYATLPFFSEFDCSKS